MTGIQRPAREVIAAVATTLALACGGGGAGGPVGNAGSIQLTVNPTTLPIQQGGGGTVSASLTRGGGFSGVVALAVTGLPTGITSTITPAQLSGSTTSATVSVVADTTVAPQTYSATVTATAQGVGQATATYQVVVTAPPPGGTSVEYQYCDVDAVPVFFAYQDGAGAWRPVTGSTVAGATKFAFKLNQARGGVLAVFQTASTAVAGALNLGASNSWQRSHRPSGILGRLRTRSAVAAGGGGQLRSFIADTYETDVMHASAAELAQDGIGNCAVTGPTKSVTATV